MKKINKKPVITSSVIYFQVGLIIALLLSIFIIEHKTEQKYSKPEPIAEINTIEKLPFQYKIIEKEKPVPVKKEKKKTDPIDNNSTPKPVDNNELNKWINKIHPTQTDAGSPAKTGEIDLEDPLGEEIPPISIVKVEVPPVFPGCEMYGSKEDRANCLASKIRGLVKDKFNGDLAQELGLSGVQKIYVNFTIDKNGNVADIKARSATRRLAEEAKRVVRLIPKMKPAQQQNSTVPVSYSLPIIFKVD